MSSREFAEWLAFAGLEPLGDARGDLQAAIIAATVANMLRGKDSKAVGIEDMLPRFDEAPVEAEEDLDPEIQATRVAQQLAAVEAWNTALGGRDLRKQQP